MSAGCFTQKQIFEAARAGEGTDINPWNCVCGGVGGWMSNVDTWHVCHKHAAPGAMEAMFEDEEISFAEMREWTEADKTAWEQEKAERWRKREPKVREFWAVRFVEQRKRAEMDSTKEQRAAFVAECRQAISDRGIHPEGVCMSDWIGAACTIADREFWPI